MNPLNFRQIHLDFHTSEKIAGIGKNFSKEQFQAMLKKGHVGSITIFSKCHHGWAYHPSEANTTHPNLDFDLLQAQIEAAHEIGVKAPVYISAGLDEKITRKHPEWLYRNKDESTTWASDFNQPGYHLFCFNTPYLDILLAQIEEVVKNYDADGIFLDIVKPKPCYCQNCVNSLLEEGKDPYDDSNAVAFGEKLYAEYTDKVRKAIDKHKPGLPVFHNGGHIAKGRHDLCQMNTHLELESLPTGGWGYDHFPLSAKYVMNEGMEYLGMTGKFHTTWGEFGGFKHPNALIYETALSIAMGAKCSIGDQLHPEGLMDPLTYEIIGEAYSQVEEKEAWCQGVKNVADIAILSAEAIDKDTATGHTSTYPMDIGANRMLLQGHYLYEFIDGDMDFDKYKVIILPDSIRLDSELSHKLNAYMNKGGKVLATGESGLAALEGISIDKTAESTGTADFAIDLGVKHIERCTNKPNYYYPEEGAGFKTPSAMIMYSESETVELTDGKILGSVQESYFNRTTFEFSSHQHTPGTLMNSAPGMIATDNSVYIPWKIFGEFAGLGSMHLRTMIFTALDYLLKGNKSLTTNLPAQGIVSYMNQPDENRSVLHLIYGTPVLRGTSGIDSVPGAKQPLEVIEDLIPIHNTEVSLKLESSVSKVYLAPQMEEIPFETEGDCIKFTVDEFTCHQMIVVE